MTHRSTAQRRTEAPGEAKAPIAGAADTLPQNAAHALNGFILGGQQQTHLQVIVQGHPPGPNDRLHWTARRRLNKVLGEQVYWLCRQGWKQPPLARARLQVTFVYKRRPFRDADNLIASVKQQVDQLVRGGVILDDSPEHLVWMPVQQILGLRKEVVMDIWPAEEGDTNV